MRILHLTDIHLTKNGTYVWDTNTKEHFDNAITLISRLHGIDMIIISGDLSNDGSLWTYEYLDNNFGNLAIPTYCCPGNHDNLKVMYQEFKPNFIQLQPATQISGINFLFLNSVIKDEETIDGNISRGLLDEHSLCFLRNELQKGLPTIITLHHPPIEQEGWLNRKLLDNRNEFNDIIQNNDNVRLVLYGHTHYCDSRRIGQVTYHSTSAIGFAFNKDLPKFQIAVGQEGFSVITLIGTQVSRIEKYTLG